MTFQEWLDLNFYPGFDASGVSDAEYYELEDAYEADELAYVAEEDYI